MKGLLLKDWYIIRNKGKVFFLIIPIYLLIALGGSQNYFFLFFTAVFVAMVPRTLAAYDEHAHWNRYTAVLPLSKGQLVLSRYLILLFFTLASLLLMVLIALGAWQLPVFDSSAVGLKALPANLALMVAITFFYAAFSMPLLYRFGVEKGRVMQSVLMIAFMVVAGIVSSMIVMPDRPEQLSQWLTGPLPFLLAAVGTVLFILSYFLSVKWYRYTDNL